MFFQNEDNSREFSEKETDRHKTHVTALTILVLVTFVVVFAALSMVGSTQQPTDRELVTDKTAIETPRPSVSEIEKLSNLDGLPNNLPLPETATVTQNYRNDLMDDHTQRVLVFRVEDSNFTDQLADDLQAWALDSEFTIAETNRINGNGIILAEKPSSQLIIQWAGKPTSTRVEINHVRI